MATPTIQKLRRYAIWLCLGLTATYFLIEATLPSRMAATSAIAMLLAQTVAFAVCLITADSESPVTAFRWRLMAISIAFRILTVFSFTFARDSELPRLCLLVGAEFLLLAVAGSFRRDNPTHVKLIDWSMAALLGLLLFTFVLSKQIEHGPPHAGVTLLDVTNIFLAASALIQWISAQGRSEHRFFYTAGIMQCVGGIVTSTHNHIQNLADLPRLDFGLILPYLLLISATLLPVPEFIRNLQPSRRVVRIGQSTGPGMVGLAIILLALSLRSFHLYISIAAIVIAVLAFSFRSGLIQNKLLETEDLLRISRQELEAMFLRDTLTGVASRKAFYAAFFSEWRIAARTHTPLSVLLVEIDHFQLMNDMQGRLLGDHCVSHIAVLLQQALGARNGDFLARFQGDQFAILLPYTSSEGAMTVAEKIQHAVDQSPKSRLGLLKRPITVSIGVSTVQDIFSDWDEVALIESAERALTEARFAGRDCSRLLAFTPTQRRTDIVIWGEEADEDLFVAYARHRSTLS